MDALAAQFPGLLEGHLLAGIGIEIRPAPLVVVVMMHPPG